VKSSRWARQHSARHPRLGPVLYLAGIQYFVVQFTVALQWVSALQPIWRYDLGNTACRSWERTVGLLSAPQLDELAVCRAGHCHDARVGSYSRYFATGRASRAAFAIMAISGAGVVVVGFFPENTVSALHGLGTAIPFTLGNASLITLALSLRMPAILRLYTFLSGVIALLGLVVYASGHYLGLGEGGIERVVAYPQTACLAVIGFYLVTRSAAPRTAPSKP
jgi:Protein of unknown function (DUF998)